MPSRCQRRLASAYKIVPITSYGRSSPLIVAQALRIKLRSRLCYGKSVQFVTPITLQNQDQSYIQCNGGVDYEEVYDAKDHHRFGTASNCIDRRNDWRFC
jgi:hypothetical protein